jgi:hypothetical protein
MGFIIIAQKETRYSVNDETMLKLESRFTATCSHCLIKESVNNVFMLQGDLHCLLLLQHEIRFKTPT